MNVTNLLDLTLSETAQFIRERRVSPVELTRVYLDRIDRLDPQINSFITVTADAALEQARQLEAGLHLADAGLLGPLYGVPLALKDLYETAGVRTTAGSLFFADHVPNSDAEVVERLKAAGAVLLGKNNLHEIALGFTTVNLHFGPTPNPWALDRISGGSSGGSGAAVAARLAPASLGTDTGGSIRVPASLCGVVGLKATRGRVSLRGVIPLSWNLDHAGPVARRVEDAALLLQVIAGYDPDDPYSADVPVDDYLTGLNEGISGWRIALAAGEYFDRTDPEVDAAVRTAASVLEDLGAHVEPLEIPDIYDASLANGRMVTADGATFHAERLRTSPENFGQDIRERLQAGAALPLADYVLARRTQTKLTRSFTRLFGDWDLLVLPTTPIAAPPIEGPDAIEMARLLSRYTAPFNLTGLPAISLPCGFTAAGLPIGLEMVAAPWAEARLLRAAASYETAAGWYTRVPEVA